MSLWPPEIGLSTVLVPQNSAVITLFHSIKVNAPASLVFNTLIQVDKYPEWNTWIRKATIVSQPDDITEQDKSSLHLGTTFIFEATMDATKSDKPHLVSGRVSDYSTPDKDSGYVPEDLLKYGFEQDHTKRFRIAWTGNDGFLMRNLLSFERFHEIVIINEKECEVRTWENQGRPLTYLIRTMLGDVLKEKFKIWCNDLRGQSEKLYQNA